MATPEQMLISKIILTDGGMKQAVEWGITREDFRTGDVQSMWDQMYAEYTSPHYPGSAIGPVMAQYKYPQWDLSNVDPNIHLDHLCHEVRKFRMSSFVMQEAGKMIEMAEQDAATAVGHLMDVASQVRSLDLGKKTDVNFYDGIVKVFTRYHKAKSGALIGKFSWPWNPLQEVTGGVQEDDYVVLYGRPKSKKTWILTYLIFWAYLSGAKILFYTKEMTDENLFMRIAAFILDAVYDDLRLGRMNSTKEERLFQLMEEAKGIRDNMICLSAKDADGLDTVAWLHGKVEKYKPDVVFIDGMYLMSTESKRQLKDNERVQAISRAIRAMNLALRVPVICTVQANRKAAGHTEANLDEIAFSDALSQDCTMAIRVIKDKDQPTVSLILGGNTREIELPDFRVYAVPCTMFGFHSMLTTADVQEAQDKDAPEAEKDKKDTGKKTTSKKNGARKKTDAKKDETFARDLSTHMKDMPQ